MSHTFPTSVTAIHDPGNAKKGISYLLLFYMKQANFVLLNVTNVLMMFATFKTGLLLIFKLPKKIKMF